MPPRLISMAALARLAGVSRMAITKACRKQLSAACVADRIDADHPAVAAYLKGKGVAAGAVDAALAVTVPAPSAVPAPTRRAPPAASPGRKGSGGPLRSSGARAQGPRVSVAPDTVAGAPPEHIESYADKTLRELIEQFGTALRFKDWLDALKKIEDIRKTRLDNDETEGRLIARELVKVHVFGAIEAANRRLLTDTAKTASRQIYEAAKAGKSMEEVEAMLRESIASQLKPVKARSARVLRARERLADAS